MTEQNNYVIVLFADGCIQVYPAVNFYTNMSRKNFQITAKFFKCSKKVTIENISEWYAEGTPEETNLNQNGLPTEFSIIAIPEYELKAIDERNG